MLSISDAAVVYAAIVCCHEATLLIHAEPLLKCFASAPLMPLHTAYATFMLLMILLVFAYYYHYFFAMAATSSLLLICRRYFCPQNEIHQHVLSILITIINISETEQIANIAIISHVVEVMFHATLRHADAAACRVTLLILRHAYAAATPPPRRRCAAAIDAIFTLMLPLRRQFRAICYALPFCHAYADARCYVSLAMLRYIHFVLMLRYATPFYAAIFHAAMFLYYFAAAYDAYVFRHMLRFRRGATLPLLPCQFSAPLRRCLRLIISLLRREGIATAFAAPC